MESADVVTVELVVNDELVEYSTVYPVSALGEFTVGAVQLTTAEVVPDATAVIPVGASAGGKTAIDCAVIPE